jgi:hypothetical protein
MLSAIGSGKTSLIRAIFQQCEDIVHIDTSSSPSSPASSRTLPKVTPKPEFPGVVEIMASTKCYPAWWTDVEENRTLRRRKSGGDNILERNLCFIDTPGITEELTQADVFKYIQQTFIHFDTQTDLSNLERLNLISGKGSPLVDVVLFLFSDGEVSEII